MGDEKTDETQIRKPKRQVWRNNGLQSSPDSPEISNFEPATIPVPKRDDDHDHRPIAELQRQRFGPGGDAEVSRDNQIANIIDQQQGGDGKADRALEEARLCSVHN